jgi:hypothetical protein
MSLKSGDILVRPGPVSSLNVLIAGSLVVTPGSETVLAPCVVFEAAVLEEKEMNASIVAGPDGATVFAIPTGNILLAKDRNPDLRNAIAALLDSREAIDAAMSVLQAGGSFSDAMSALATCSPVDDAEYLQVRAYLSFAQGNVESASADVFRSALLDVHWVRDGASK